MTVTAGTIFAVLAGLAFLCVMLGEEIFGLAGLEMLGAGLLVWVIAGFLGGFVITTFGRPPS